MIIIYIYPKFIPKFNLLFLYLSHLNTIKSQNNPKFPKCVRNTSQIYPKFNFLSLHLSHSNTVNIKTKHTYFFIIIYIYPKCIPKFNLLSLYLSHSNTAKSKNNPKFPKCVRNTSQIYPKFNFLSLHLSHSNTVNIK